MVRRVVRHEGDDTRLLAALLHQRTNIPQRWLATQEETSIKWGRYAVKHRIQSIRRGHRKLIFQYQCLWGVLEESTTDGSHLWWPSHSKRCDQQQPRQGRMLRNLHGPNNPTNERKKKDWIWAPTPRECLYDHPSNEDEDPPSQDRSIAISRSLHKSSKFKSLFDQLDFGIQARTTATEALMRISAKHGPQCYANEAAVTRAFLESNNSVTFTDEDMKVPYSYHCRLLYLEVPLSSIILRGLDQWSSYQKSCGRHRLINKHHAAGRAYRSQNTTQAHHQDRNLNHRIRKQK